MPLLSLDLNKPSRSRAPAKLPSSGRYLLQTYSNSRRWFPRRGFLFSLLVHEIAIVALMFFSPSSSPSPRVWREKQWDTTMIPKDVLYLPQLGGGSEGGSAETAGGVRGVTYAGKQQIISNPQILPTTFKRYFNLTCPTLPP